MNIIGNSFNNLIEGFTSKQTSRNTIGLQKTTYAIPKKNLLIITEENWWVNDFKRKNNELGKIHVKVIINNKLVRKFTTLF